MHYHPHYYRPNPPLEGAPKLPTAGTPNVPGVEEAPKVGAAGAPKVKPLLAVCGAPNVAVVPNPFPAGDPKAVVAGVLVVVELNAGAAGTEPKALDTGATPNPLLFWATGVPKDPTPAEPNVPDEELAAKGFEAGAPKAGADDGCVGEPKAAGLAAADPKAEGAPKAFADTGAPKVLEEGAPNAGAPVAV